MDGHKWSKSLGLTRDAQLLDINAWWKKGKLLTDQWCHSVKFLHLATPALVISPMHASLEFTAGLVTCLGQTHQDGPSDSPSLAFIGVLMPEKEGRAMTSPGSFHCTWSARGPRCWDVFGPHYPWDVDGDMSRMEGHNQGTRCCCNFVVARWYFWEPTLAFRKVVIALWRLVTSLHPPISG